MRKSLVAIAVLSALAAPTVSQAEEAASPHSFSYNVGLYSEYMFRGLAQTGEELALQGGVDYAHESGFYVGAWASNISWLEDDAAYENSSLELDIYGGFASTIGETGIGYDVGLLQYIYPGNRISSAIKDAETTELYAALSYEWISAKISYGLTDIFGFKNTDGSYYYELNADYPIGETGLTVSGHIGRQEFAGNGNEKLHYTDYKIGLAKAWDNGVELGAFYTDTSSSKNDNSAAGYVDGSGTYLGDDAFVAYVSKSF
jgi:uncharacterized protein (TIGR02001 family)